MVDLSVDSWRFLRRRLTRCVFLCYTSNGRSGMHDNKLLWSGCVWHVLRPCQGRCDVCSVSVVVSDVCSCFRLSLTNLERNRSCTGAHRFGIWCRFKRVKHVTWPFALRCGCNVSCHRRQWICLTSSMMAWMLSIVAESSSHMAHMTRVPESSIIIIRSAQYMPCLTGYHWLCNVRPWGMCKDDSRSAPSSKMFSVVADQLDVYRCCAQKRF